MRWRCKTGGGAGLNKRASPRGISCPASSGMPSLCSLLPVNQAAYKRTARRPTSLSRFSHVPDPSLPSHFCPPLSPFSLPSWLCFRLCLYPFSTSSLHPFPQISLL
ncbi:rCG49192 [Rattus norvegicus]|uniref:RCG49192 n=1 Tax=Rattus norvegicus TaxID=10116 RepID=A6IFK4_RAT|nr:rCG49192 [Rattus norvegicus]